MAAACSTSGRLFDSSALKQIIPGQTTLAEASLILGADPVDTYRQLNGTVTARWAHNASLLTDAIYFRQELSLLFGPDGRFEHIVEKTNVPGQAGKASVPLQPAPVYIKSSQPPVANPLAQSSTEGIASPAETYPLSH